MNQLYAYLCPVCASVAIFGTRRVGAYHETKVWTGRRFQWVTHALKEAGVFDGRMTPDEIKAAVLADDYNGGVREIPHEAKELGMGVVVRQPAKVKRWRR